MSNFRKILFKSLTGVFVLLSSACFAQFYNNGSQIAVGNGALVYVKNGDLVNVDSSIYNNGTILVDKDCVIRNKNTSRIVTNNGDSLIVRGAFSDSSLAGQRSGVLVLRGSTQTIYSKSFAINSLVLDGAGDKTLASDIVLRANLNLIQGHVIVPTIRSFSLDSTSTLSPSTITSQSFVVGQLNRKRKLGAEDSLFYPIGSTTSQYRPAVLQGIALPSGKYPIIGLKTSLAAPQAGSEVSGVYSRVWGMTNPSNADIKNIKLYYQSSEVASSVPSNLVVAQSNSANGVYNSIGAESFSSSYVKSELKPTGSFYTLGASIFLRANFKVFLEGPYNGSGGMSIALNTKSVLSDTLLKSFAMTAGYSVPTNAVDKITFTLVDSITGVKSDSAYAWLLSNGAIADYQTGTRNYVTFLNANPTSRYFVYVSHRNHLVASSKSLILASTKPAPAVFNFDYTKGVYGGGAFYHLASNAWLLYASDPFKSWKNQTDVVDLVRTWTDEDSGLYRITGKDYRYTDLNLDGNVNSADQSLANDHNNKLYYSTLPK